MFFVGDHTFFGDVVNIAETLQTSCWYKVMDLSLYTSSLITFPLKRQQKSGLYSVQQQQPFQKVYALKTFYRMHLAPFAFCLLDWVSWTNHIFGK